MFLLDVWLAADSLVSSPGSGSGQRVLSPGAAKIIPIPIRLYEANQSGPGYLPIYEGQLGFAFAGSTFSATMTQSLVMSCFTSLCGDFDAKLPSMQDLVDFICKVGTRYIRDSASVFEACVVGSDCDKRGLAPTRCFHLTYSGASRSMTGSEVDLDTPGAFVLLGDRKADVGKLVAEGFAVDPTYRPSDTLAKIIEDAGFESIGGALQLGRASQGWFRLLPTWGYSPTATAFPKLLGLGDEHGLGDVGAFYVGEP